jgi:hypothetical protein
MNKENIEIYQVGFEFWMHHGVQCPGVELMVNINPIYHHILLIRVPENDYSGLTRLWDRIAVDCIP